MTVDAEYFVTVTRVTREGSTDIWRGKVGDGEDDNLVIKQGDPRTIDLHLSQVQFQFQSAGVYPMPSGS